jgi:hypothetical protein
MIRTGGAYPSANRGKVVVWGYLASYPFGGMTWQVLHYLVGLRRLGFDVWYVEDTDGELLDPETLWSTENYASNVQYLKRQMESVGLGNRWILRLPGTHELCHGDADIQGLSALYREADAVINLCGSHELRQEHDRISCLVYLQTDPVPKQIAVAKGDSATIGDLARYHYLFTYGENIGADDCLVPIEHFTWHATRPPVIVDWWQSSGQPAVHGAFSTVTNWSHTWNDVTWRGERWRWCKHYEFRKLRCLPQHCSVPLELAVVGSSDEEGTVVGISDEEAEAFRSAGWRLRDASELTDPDVYREYIRGSLGEFTVVKEQYVRPRTGWFSDRSVCYLAAGRPVVMQETGFSKFIPCGKGLLPFLTGEGAQQALETVCGDYKRHSEAALTLAREYFDADTVLHRLAKTIGLL